MGPIVEAGEGPGNVRPAEPIAEWRRLQETDIYGVPWRKWGPYLAERAWGTVREDYSADGDAWSYFPWDQAVSRAYRWNEDGMAGICDDRQLLCLALALWNGHDPILKERAFGLTNSQGNHGEDVKECWWYLDATPTSAGCSDATTTRRLVPKWRERQRTWTDSAPTGAARTGTSIVTRVKRHGRLAHRCPPVKTWSTPGQRLPGAGVPQVAAQLHLVGEPQGRRREQCFRRRFLGPRQHRAFDRSRPLPVPGVLEQSDGTAWMAMYCMSLLEIGLRLADTDPTYEDIAVRFYEHHLDHPFTLEVGNVTATIDYEPGESTTGLFGGNSNWRGPVWFPLNYLFINALYRYGRYYDQSMKVEHPVGSGVQLTLDEVADEITRRLVSLFLPGPDGRRPVHGDDPLLQEDPAWRDLIWFHEYFHGDTGAGLGASHQTGWTGLVLHLIAAREMATDER